jgi:hypothetical protein
LGAFGATVLIGEVWIIIDLSEYIGHYGRLDPDPHRGGWDHLGLWAVPSQGLGESRDYRSALRFLAASTLPFLVLLILIAALPAGLVGGAKFDIRRVPIEVLECALIQWGRVRLQDASSRSGLGQAG